MLAAPLTTPLCLYNTKLNFTFPLQSISLRDITPLYLCHSSHHSTLFHFAITERHSALPLRYQTQLHLSIAKHILTEHYSTLPLQNLSQRKFSILYQAITVHHRAFPLRYHALCSSLRFAFTMHHATPPNFTIPLHHSAWPFNSSLFLYYALSAFPN